MGYDAFISYSHAADSQLAPRLQDGMQRMARPWYRRRALHVFRDNTGLTANPGLWSSIASAMDDSEWFVFLASPEAAASPWVDRELSHWLETRSVDHILPVVTDGEWVWDDEKNDFDVARSTAVPTALLGAFEEEPRHIDMRWAHSEEQVDLRHPHFRDDVAAIAAPMHGLAKDELVGEDVRQHRRTMRWAWGAAVALVVLTLGSAAAMVLAVRNADEADAAKSEAQENAAEADANASEASRQKAIADENAAEAAAKAEEALENEQQADANAATAQQQQQLAEQNANEASQQRSAAEASALEAQAQAAEAARQAQAAIEARDAESAAKADAQVQAQAALRAQAEAVAEKENAVQQERIAQYERASAVFATAAAEVARQQAETQALAAASAAQSSEDPALSLLLAVEANNRGEGPDAAASPGSFASVLGEHSPVGRRALFEAVTAARGGTGAYPIDRFLPMGSDVGDPPAFLWRPTLSPDGRWLAAAEFPDPLTGTRAPFPARIFVWDLEAGGPLKVLVGHEHMVGNLSFASGGTLVSQDSPLSGATAPTVRVWDLATARATQVRTDAVPFVAPDGEFIAIQLRTVGAVEFIEARTRLTTTRQFGMLAPDLYATQGPFGAEPQPYLGRPFSRDGRYALGTSGGVAVLWDLRAGGRVPVPLITPDGFFSEAPSIDPTGQIATAIVDGVKLVFFRPSDGLPLLEDEIAGPTEILLNTVWSNDGSRFAVLVYDWVSGASRVLVAVNGVGSFVVESPTCEFGLGFAGQCDVAFTINGNDLTLEVPTDSTGFTFFTEVLDGDTGAPQLAFDGRVLALGGPDSSLVFGQHVDANGRPHLFVEDLTQGRTVFSEDDPTRTVVAAVADAERLVVSTEDGAVRAWDLRDGRGPIDLVAARSLMIGLVLDASAPTEPRVYGVGIGSGVTQWDLSNPGAADRIGTTGQGAALADDGESVVEPSPDGRQILVRNLVTGAVTSGPVLAPGEQIDYLLTRSSQGPVVANLVAGSAVVTSGPRVVGRVPVPVADISRSGTRLATVPSDARVVDVIDVGDLGSVTRSIELSALSPDAYQEVPDVVALDSTGQRLAATNATGEVVVWDVSSGAVLAELRGAPVDLRSFPLFGLSFSPEGLRLVVKSPSNLVRMYSTATWTEVANQQLSARDTAGRVVFSPDGEFVAVDGLFLFDGTTLEPVARLVSGTGIGTKFSADNHYLSTITDRGEVLRWDIGVAALVDQACTLAGRNMTPQEWTRYMGAVPYRETCPR